MHKLTALVAAATISGFAAPTLAQTFPADADWDEFYCGADPMTDGHRDQPTAEGPRDVVGNNSAPAGFRAFDDEFLYLRVRVDDDPTQGTGFQPFAWGVEFDLDENLSTYELLIMVEGGPDVVNLYQNTDVTSSNDPGDPADQPEVASYNARTHAAAKVLSGSSFGDDDDWAVDMAVPWTDLEPLGLDVETALSVWVGTSSGAKALDGDIACHDGASGAPTLSDNASDPTTTDPTTDSDGDGFTDEQELRAGTDPNDPDSTPGVVAGDGQLEGGGGCSTSEVSESGNLAAFAFLLLVLVAAGSRRRARLPTWRR